MATFNQEKQTVQYQYNAETINFGSVKTADDFLLQLKNLQAALDKAITAKVIPDEDAIDAEDLVKKAIDQAKSPSPDKKTLVEHLSSAKELVSNAGGLAVAITRAIAAARALF